MPNIKINFANVLSEAGRCDDASRRVSSANSSIRSTANQIDGGILSRNNIAGRINNICNSLSDITNRINSIKSVCNNGANKYKGVDAANKQRAASIDTSRLGKLSKSESKFK